MNKYLKSVYTDGSIYFVSNPLPKKGEAIKIRLRALTGNNFSKVILFTKLDGVSIYKDMEVVETKNGLDYFECEVTCNEDELHYIFYIVSEGRLYYYNQRGILDYMPSESYDFRILYDYIQPTWVKGTVFYQIFPERFCNGNEDNDVQDNEYYFEGNPTIKRKWTDTVLPHSESHCLDFFGGDLQGIESKIDYLKRLGINALYLNPIFYAATNHKYDCLDYFNVDPHFGGNEALASLTKALHEAGIRIILDVSINHTGTAHKWFNKEGLFFDKSLGAYNNPDSKERQYYFFNEKNEYKAWYDCETLPTLNYTSQELRNILYKDEYSVVKKWLKPPFNIDGWRFDVADIMARNGLIQLHHEVWPQIRKAIKETKKDAYILCEDWTDCTEFLKGNEWDSAMNYFGFGRPFREFAGEGDTFNRRNKDLPVVKTTSESLKNRLVDYLGRMPYVIQENQFNLFDSHDIGRLHTNPTISYADYRGAVISLFTMIGAANMYYGDEADLDGDETNEGCRHPMPWHEDFEKKEQFKLYQTLCHLKTSEDSLINGGYKFFDCTDYVFSFIRFNLDEGFITVNARNDETVKLELPLKDFGFKLDLGKTDVFNTELDYEVKNDVVILNVKPHTSLLIKVSK
jgi:alpha-glucosidase